LRVLVVDDSIVQRQILSKLLAQDPGIELAGSAGNGAEAVRAVARLRPDVVTLDDRMPIMNGLEAARHIMRETPTPIVMISAASGEDARRLTAAALAAGVVAVQGKRALSSSEPAAGAELVRLIKDMATVRVVRRRREPLPNQASITTPPVTAMRPSTPEIIAIGASTGGPQALREILAGLPPSFPLPVLIVQHTTVGYSNTLAEWLTGSARLPVRVAEDGQPLDKGGIFVAPGGRHLTVSGGKLLALVDGPTVSLHRPSATVLFTSVAAVYGARSVGILLTGMGDDGARGMLKMKQAGALTIAQDKSTSVVFGMPAEAIRMGAVDHALAPNEIVRVLLEHIATQGQERAAWT
jgi:two-component system chemotaxis response regulator CheB